MTHPNIKFVTLSIPNHPRVKLPVLHGLIKKAGLTDKIYRATYDLL